MHHRFIIALASLFIAFASLAGCASQPGEPGSGGTATLGLEVMEVGDAELEDLAAGDTYLVDLSLEDVVWRIDADAELADSRVAVRSSRGEETILGNMLGDRAAVDGRRVLTLAGDPTDLDALRTGREAVAGEGAESVGSTAEPLRAIGGYQDTGCSGGNNFSCGLWSCSCDGDTDCNDMFCSDVCNGDAVCDETGGSTHCWCWRGWTVRAAY